MAEINRTCTSPIAVAGFPFEDFQHLEDETSYSDDSSVDSSDTYPWDDEHNICDTVYAINAQSRVCAIHQADAHLVHHITKVNTSDNLADTGANINMGNNLSALVDVVDIKPFTVSLALDSQGKMESLQCTKKGKLPLSCTNGSIHYTTMFYNTDATDMIISPQAICDDSNGLLVTWMMKGTTTGNDGRLEMTSSSSLYSIVLPLTKLHGLYYCKSDTFQCNETPYSIHSVSTKTSTCNSMTA